MKRKKMYRRYKDEGRPNFKRLIVHLARPNYKCSSNDRWIHDDPDSECEDGPGGNVDGNDGGDRGNGGDGGRWWW